MVDECTKKTLSSIPLLQTRAGPRDKDIWVQRLKEEYLALIKVKSHHLIKKILQAIRTNIALNVTVCPKQQRKRFRLVPFGIE